MGLTAKRLAEFVGGELEIQNENYQSICRGPIAEATIGGPFGIDVKIRFTWLAKNDGGLTQPRSMWTKIDQLEYTASLETHAVSDIGEGRLCLSSSLVGEMVVFFPPDGSKLDPSRVAGL